MNKKLLLTIGIASLILLAGCTGTAADGEELSNASGQDISGATVGESYAFESKMTEKNQYQLVQERPPFQMEDSLERQNLIRRYEYLNDQNNQHHVYMYTEAGQILSYQVAQGKVSSVNSKLTNDKQIVARNECLRETSNGGEGACYEAVESPQMDGSYGTNGNAIFFFTPEGEYVEYNGRYIVSEEPMSIQSQVMLVEQTEDSQSESEDN